VSEADALDEVATRLGRLARRDVPIGPLTTYRVGGPAAVFVAVETEADLAVLAAAVRATGVPTLAVGRGSNLLVADRGFAGVAFTLGEAFAGIERRGGGASLRSPPGGAAGPMSPGSAKRDRRSAATEVESGESAATEVESVESAATEVESGESAATEVETVRAGAAASLPVVARRTVAWGLTGFEWAVGVPGSIGGAVRMNAGGHGADMATSLERVRVVDLRADNDDVVPAPALELRYRGSAVGPSHVVVWAELGLRPGDRAAGEAELAEIVQWRRANQPGGQNAGSVFTNPPGDSAGRLVEAAGCKGLRMGSAEVSPKHANFIQADEGGSADDVRALMDHVRARVRAESGVDLVPETHTVGFDQ
jgi:UDP-N-acetylmuramate dehydrogenase